MATARSSIPVAAYCTQLNIPSTAASRIGIRAFSSSLCFQRKEAPDPVIMSAFLPGWPNDAAKTKMTSGSIDGLGHARRWSIAPAVVRCAQVRSAFHDFPRDLDVRHVGIVAFVSFSAFGVETRAARLRYLFVLLVPVRGPLPYVAGHIAEPVTVGRKTSH